MKFSIVTFIVTVVVLSVIYIYNSSTLLESRVLKDYVEKYDPNYKWTLNATYNTNVSTIYILELTSQKWDMGNSSSPLWKHWLTVCIPNNATENLETGLLLIDGGSTVNWAVPSVNGWSSFGQQLCKTSNEITATVQQVPNEPLIFDNNGIKRSEDGIVALTWRKYIDTKDSNWVSLLPQTKSAIKAMDAVQEFGKEIGKFSIKNFVVTGASKRGWTTWGTAMSSDKRVVGIAPMVIPILNVAENIGSQMQDLGEWSFELYDYIQNGITNFLYTKYFDNLRKIIDPINYINTLEPIAKYVLNAADDEFFAVDSPKFFYSKLKGETRLNTYPNTNHNGIKKQAVANDIVNFFKLVAFGIERPEIEWSIEYSQDKNFGTIKMKVLKGVPTKISIWFSTTISTTMRDFRMYTCEDASCYQNLDWQSIDIEISPENNYFYTMEKPAAGWTGFFYQVEFDTGSYYSTEVSIVPDILPFPKCPMSICASGIPAYKNKTLEIENNN
ncbi:hypothetical protein ACTFIR_006240 [Dictyostelium discoideum]